MASPYLSVTKTLVIGLGTTGTRICNLIASRIKWEYGSLDRTPWVRFLCMETNASGMPDELSQQDFIPLTISPDEYAEIVQFRPAYDEAIQLSRWADKNTLQKIPGNAVDDGVGNIRMIGRLAFFHRKNYDRVRNAVQARIIDLRTLTGPDASEKLGTLADGTMPAVAFASKDALRIFVVGTLCGGTCSGLAGDFGYFLHSIAKVEEKVIGIFTLPHPSLSVAAVAAAERYKMNAYASLVELNHYHLMTGVEKDVIPFPGHPFPTQGVQPYDLPYLLFPRQNDEEARRGLETAIKDRIFLNIFVPATDPFASTVDASIMDRNGHAHSFCTFGLSTIEFPAQRVMDACTKTLVQKAVRDWKSRSLPEKEMGQRLQEIGLTYPSLQERLLASSGGTPVRTQLDDAVKVILDAARHTPEKVEEHLAGLRSAFGEPASASALPLLRNLVPETVANNIGATAQQVQNRLRDFVFNHFLDYNEGPGRLLDLLKGVKTRLDDLRQTTPRDAKAQVKAVENALTAVNASRKKKSLFSKELVADELKVADLQKALNAEIQSRLNSECERAMTTTENGKPRRGVPDMIARSVDPMVQRVGNLRMRLTAYQARLDANVHELTEEVPSINGVALYDTNSRNGTVRTEYKKCLLNGRDDQLDSYEAAELEAAEAVIHAWKTVCPALFPDAGQEWLRETFVIGAEEPLRPEDEDELLGQARITFAALRGENVIDHWKTWPNASLEVTRACKVMEPFLPVDDTHAQHGGRAPVQKRKTALIPGADRNSKFCQLIETQAGIEQFNDCPDPYRAVLISEWYRFPLYAARDIVGNANSLSTTQAKDFPTFFTRKDVDWTGLSEADIEKTRDMEQLVVIGVLLGILKPKAGKLNMSWSPRGTGQDTVKQLPMSIRGAARALVNQRIEVDGVEQQLKDAATVLRDRIQDKRQAFTDADKPLAFVHALDEAFKSGDANYIPDWQTDNFAGRLVDRFCARDPELFKAWCAVYPPDEAKIRLMWKSEGDRREVGGVYREAGLYCTVPTCCGFVGKDEQDAARNGWQCYLEPTHDYSGRA